VVTEETLKTWPADEWPKWWVERKIDGGRMTFCDGTFASRTDKPFYNLERIAEELKELPGWMLDGEAYAGSWAKTMSILRSKKAVDNTDLRFCVFDTMSKFSWRQGRCLDILEDRRSELMMLTTGMQYVVPILPEFANSYEEFATLHKRNLAEGCDGTVLKRIDSLYEFKRTKTWLKVKPCLDVDGVVIDMEEGKGKYKGMLGALVVRQDSDKGCDLVTKVSGMTDMERELWWNNRGLLIGKTIEVKIRGYHPSGSWIEPRFHRIREDA